MPSTSTPRSRARDDTEEWIVDFGIFAHYCYGYILFIGAKITKNIETAGASSELCQSMIFS